MNTPTVTIGTPATIVYYTDCEPAEVIAVSKSGRKITLRKMQAVLDPTWKPEEHIGGFMSHVSNNHGQRWIVTPDPDGAIMTANWSEKKTRYFIGRGIKVTLGKAVKFYDYNF